MSEQDDIAPGGIDAGNQLRAAPAGRRQNDGSRGSGFVGRIIFTSTIDQSGKSMQQFLASTKPQFPLVQAN